MVVNGSSDQGACEAVAEEARSHGVGAQVAMGDVGQADNIRQISEMIFEEFDGVEILVKQRCGSTRKTLSGDDGGRMALSPRRRFTCRVLYLSGISAPND